MREEASESYMVGTLEFKAIMINMLRAIMKKMTKSKNIRVGNERREMEMLKQNKIKMLQIKNTVTEMKYSFAMLISRLNTVWGGNF